MSNLARWNRLYINKKICYPAYWAHAAIGIIFLYKHPPRKWYAALKTPFIHAAYFQCYHNLFNNLFNLLFKLDYRTNHVAQWNLFDVLTALFWISLWLFVISRCCFPNLKHSNVNFNYNNYYLIINYWLLLL